MLAPCIRPGIAGLGGLPWCCFWSVALTRKYSPPCFLVQSHRGLLVSPMSARSATTTEAGSPLAKLLHPIEPKKRNPRGKRPSSLRIGLIHLDMFNIEIPVFASEADRVQELTKAGFYVETDNKPFRGLAGWTSHKETNQIQHYIVITDQGDECTWAHEASHIVDMVFDLLGIPPGIESTEIRSYTLGHIFGCLMGIMDAYAIKLESQNQEPQPAKETA